MASGMNPLQGTWKWCWQWTCSQVRNDKKWEPRLFHFIFLQQIVPYMCNTNGIYKQQKCICITDTLEVDNIYIILKLVVCPLSGGRLDLWGPQNISLLERLNSRKVLLSEYLKRYSLIAFSFLAPIGTMGKCVLSSFIALIAEWGIHWQIKINH